MTPTEKDCTYCAVITLIGDGEEMHSRIRSTRPISEQDIHTQVKAMIAAAPSLASGPLLVMARNDMTPEESAKLYDALDGSRLSVVEVQALLEEHKRVHPEIEFTNVRAEDELRRDSRQN